MNNTSYVLFTPLTLQLFHLEGFFLTSNSSKSHFFKLILIFLSAQDSHFNLNVFCELCALHQKVCSCTPADAYPRLPPWQAMAGMPFLWRLPCPAKLLVSLVTLLSASVEGWAPARLGRLHVPRNPRLRIL
jgi:hypothetical protein